MRLTLIEPLGWAPRIGLPNVLVNNMAQAYQINSKLATIGDLCHTPMKILSFCVCPNVHNTIWTHELCIKSLDLPNRSTQLNARVCSGVRVVRCSGVSVYVSECVCVRVCVCGGREREREAQQKKEAETKKERHGGRNTKNKKSSNITWYDRGNETYLTRCEVWIRSHLCDIHISIEFSRSVRYINCLSLRVSHENERVNTPHELFRNPSLTKSKHNDVIVFFNHRHASMVISWDCIIEFECLFSQNRLSILASHASPARDSLGHFVPLHVLPLQPFVRSLVVSCLANWTA